jgi:hypothetical protein
MYLKHIRYENVVMICLAQDRDRWLALENMVINMTVFWDVVPCSLLRTDRNFKILTASGRPDDGGSKYL